jgi:hypothetical protein
MTKSKTKQGMPEMCHNCKFAQQTVDFPITTILCTKTDKEHKWEYSCKKWRIQE